MLDVRFWPLASFHGDAIIQSLSEPSGHWPLAKLRALGRERPRADVSEPFQKSLFEPLPSVIKNQERV
jgi:hypothetical protein